MLFRSNADSEPSSLVHLSAKPRAEPKMPAGASVAFYRESNSGPSVTFTVSSELEDARQSDLPSVLPPNKEPSPALQAFGDSIGREIDSINTLATPRDKAESKSSDGSVGAISAIAQDV